MRCFRVANNAWHIHNGWHLPGSTLAQVMACCLTARSHYLNHCWFIISKVPWYLSEGIIWKRQSVKKDWNLHLLKSHPDLPGNSELTRAEMVMVTAYTLRPEQNTTILQTTFSGHKPLPKTILMTIPAVMWRHSAQLLIRNKINVRHPEVPIKFASGLAFVDYHHIF